MKTKLAKITLTTSLSALLFSATLLAGLSLSPQTAKAQTTQIANTQTTTQTQITPRPTDEIIYTTAQGLAVKKQNATLYITINNTQYEVLGQGNGAYSNYKTLEYLQTSGTQYINTGYFHTSSTKLEMGLYVFKNSIDYHHKAFGARGYNSSSASYVNAFELGVCFRGEYYGFFNVGNGQGVSIAFSSFIYDQYITLYANGSKASFTNGTTTYEANYGTNQLNSRSEYALYLFALNHLNEANEKVIGRLYTCKIWENNKLVRNYIAIQNASGTNGFWDTINNKFYPNAGTGSFTAGPTITFNKHTPSDPAAQAIQKESTKRQIAGIDFYPGVEAGYLLCKNSAGEYLQVLI